uniref:Uncharacterized protein n=1 Tax=Romanomermis culicivorax TaxID=13658 RepID=A0A915L7L6_ROMCU
MHDLISRVLDQRDLSRARDLFSLQHDHIIKDIQQICQKLTEIFSARSYITDANCQSVVEISISRITAAIRESDVVEICAVHLINMLDQCIKYNVNRIDNVEENPPHAKLASDILSCIFLHYDKKVVMIIAVPVAMKILRKNNRDLVRSTSSYLVLAAIQNPKLFSKFVNCILSSILDGNLSLVRLLPQLYADNKEAMVSNMPKILQFFDLFDSSEKTIVLNLCVIIADTKPEHLCKDAIDFLISLSCKFDQNLIDSLSYDLLPLIELYYVAISKYLQNYNLNNYYATRICVKKLKELCETVELSNLPTASDNVNQATLISLPGESKFDHSDNQLKSSTKNLNFVDSSNNSLKSSSSFKSGATTADSYTNLLINGNNYRIMDMKCESSIDNPVYGHQNVSRNLDPKMEDYYEESLDKNFENDRCTTNDSRSYRSSGSAIFYGFRSRSVNNLSSPFRSKSSSSNKASRIQREKQLEKIR